MEICSEVHPVDLRGVSAAQVHFSVDLAADIDNDSASDQLYRLLVLHLTPTLQQVCSLGQWFLNLLSNQAWVAKLGSAELSKLCL